MNIYSVKLEINAEILACSQEDAVEYVNDIFGIDEEVKSVKIINIKEK